MTCTPEKDMAPEVERRRSGDMDYAEEQENELMALESMYMEDFVKMVCRPSCPDDGHGADPPVTATHAGGR